MNEAAAGPYVIRNVLLATDFSPSSGDAAVFAHAIARQAGAGLHVLHVERPNVAVTRPPELSKLARELGADVRVTTAIASGAAADEIARYAERNGVDLVVVGRHGHTGISRALVGSIAERLARTAPCPVVTVPADRHRWTELGERIEGAERCIVCGARSDALICEACRARLRAMVRPPSWMGPEQTLMGDLDQEQIEQILKSEIIGRLGCHAGGKTYVVPIGYAYEKGAIYIHSGDGMKVRMMRANPNVCFEVDRIQDLANWQSVVAWGTFRELGGQDAVEALSVLHRRFASLTAAEGTKPGPAAHEVRQDYGRWAVVDVRAKVVGRIELHEKTGRFEQI